MKVRCLALLLCALACSAATDTVVVLETNPGMEAWLAQTTVPHIPLGSAVGIVTFAGKPKVRQTITDNQEKLTRALRRVTTGSLKFGPTVRRADAPVFAAVMTAARLLGQGGGRIVLLFGSEEHAMRPTAAELQQALAAARIRLDAVAVRRGFPLGGSRRDAQTPPTVPGGYPPVSRESMPLPEATLAILKGVCRATGGTAQANRWNLAALLDH